MINIQKELEKQKGDALMILQVHDELVFDVKSDEVEEISDMVKEKMENALELRVPLVVDITGGANWYK